MENRQKMYLWIMICIYFLFLNLLVSLYEFFSCIIWNKIGILICFFTSPKCTLIIVFFSWNQLSTGFTKNLKKLKNFFHEMAQRVAYYIFIGPAGRLTLFIGLEGQQSFSEGWKNYNGKERQKIFWNSRKSREGN